VAGVVIETEWDFNRDGVYDRVSTGSFGNLLYLSKADGSFHYVPQKLPAGNLQIGDLNGDGLVDVAMFDGAFVTIYYQTLQTPVNVEPTPAPTPDTGVTTQPPPAPVVDTGASTTSGAPAIDPDAQEAELSETVAAINENSVLLASGQTLWFNADTVIKYNDASGFAAGQQVEFTAWENPDGVLIGIKVEIP
jgi:hypothetical protein